MIADNASGGSVFGDHFPAKWLCFSLSKTSLKAGGVKKVGYTFLDGIQGGKVGLLVVNAHSHFDDVVVSCQVIDDFRDGDADGWAPTGGTWQVENPFYGEYSGQDGGTQLSLWSQSMTSGRVGAAVIAQAGLELQYNGYLVFDYLDGSNYKYAGMDGTGQRWVIREVISGTDTLRAGVAGTIVKGTLYDVEVQVSGNLATLKVGGVVKTSYSFDGIQGGQVGLRIAQAHTHFKEVYLRAFSQVTKYYTFGGQRIAMRRDHVLSFLAGDHLGTTSVVLDAAGSVVDESRHYPYGTERWPQDGTFPTEYRFTGQLLDASLGLYRMGARWYDSYAGRFVSSDTMTPRPQNPQGFNRYAYAYGNPCRYSDPSGHSCADALEGYPAEQYDCLALDGDFLVFYLNGLGGLRDYERVLSGDEYQSILFALSLLAGEENVIHVPVFTEPYRRGISQLDMVGEALGIGADKTQFAAQFIVQYLADHPLGTGQQLVLVGSSAGGTVAVETLDLLAKAGIHVDQLILRGSLVHELGIDNVDRVDYIAADPPQSDLYYSTDINPCDSVNVNEHRVFGFSGHVPSPRQVLKIAGLIVDLIIAAQPR